MSDLAANLTAVQKTIGEACARAGREASEVTLIAVSKYTSLDNALALRDLGVADFGENRLPGALEKQEALAPARVHFIGSLQTNKVNKIVGAFASLHSLDRPALLEAVAKRAEALEIVMPCFVQVNVSGEGSKSGLPPEELGPFLDQVRATPAIRLEGLMTMAPRSDNESLLREVFSACAQLGRAHGVTGLSMGMSGDYQLAIEEGATHVRVGSRLFS